MVDSPSHSLNETDSPSSSVPIKPPKSKFYFITYFFSKSLIFILVLLLFFFFPSQVPEIFKKTTILTKLWDLIYLFVIGIAVCYGLFSRKIDTVHTSDEPAHSDDTYLSEISHISSIFENGIQNSYGFEEKSLLEEVKGSGKRFFEIGDGFGDSDGKKLNQYFLGESLVVINDEKYVLEQLSKPKTTKQNKPVRNLGSRSLDSAAGKSVVEDSSSSGWEEIKKRKLRGLVPIKLEEKFKETDSGSDSDSDSKTPLKWRSKSLRLGKRECMCTTEPNETSNFRPLSDGIPDFEDLKSKSVKFSMPAKTKDLSEKQQSKGIEPYVSTETSFMESKPQESNPGSFTEMNNLSNSTESIKGFEGTLDAPSERILKDFGKNKVDDEVLDSKINTQFVIVKSKSQSSSTSASSETNLKTAVNTYKRGKSVRTNRSKEQQVVEAKGNATDDKVELISKSGIDAKTDELSDTEPHSGEVDRKAEEFIAKFREQIRLQKVASMRKLYIR